MDPVTKQPDLLVGIVATAEAEVIPGPETLARQAAEQAKQEE